MNRVKTLILSLAAPLSLLAQIEIAGPTTIEITPDMSTGLNKVYVVRDASQAKMIYTASSATVTWQRFSNLGGAYAQEIAYERSGATLTATLEGNMGYIITDGNTRQCFWVVDYTDFPYNITGLAVAESDCDRLALNVVGSAPEIPYYTINGRRMILDRRIALRYNTLTYDSGSEQYITTESETFLESASGTVRIPAPLCATSVTISPGRFASAWGEGREVESQWVEPVAVAAEVSAVQAEHDADNEQTTGDTDSGLGGSAPAEVTFTAAVTDAAIFRRWEFSSSPDFEDTNITFSDLAVTYTFDEAGTVYVRFICDNAAGSCRFESEVFAVTIGESRLDCPNAFSPGTSEGVNDEWKVSYRSIIRFHCEIFNRWGQKLATLTDPSQGWDGKVGGKPVSSGVYFYVINALGSDGKKYKLSGDINVISSRRQSNLQSGAGE